jgi:hypothetical protein
MHDIDQKRVEAEEGHIVDDLVREERSGDERSELDHGGGARFFAIAQAMRAALQGDAAGVEAQSALLDPQQRMAIELLHDAVAARTGQISFIDAERRTLLLNQALATLQPVLALGLVPEMADGHELYGALVGQVEQLRERLYNLADAQEEIIAEGKKPEEEEEGDEDGDDDGEGDGEAAGDSADADPAAPAKPVKRKPPPAKDDAGAGGSGGGGSTL